MLETSNLDHNGIMIDTTRFSWQLTGDQLNLVNTKNVSQRLYFALLFKFYEYQHCFFQSPADIPKRAIKIIKKQLDIPSSKLFCKSIPDRTLERYRAEIRDYFQSRTIRQLETILSEAKKLKFLKALALPECLYNIPMKALQRHYRRMIAPVLELLEFDTQNTHYKPVIEALNVIQSQLDSGTTYYQVIKESSWLDKMALEDKRAITPLLHEHLNPYGIFLLNLDTRIAVNHPIMNEAA